MHIVIFLSAFILSVVCTSGFVMCDNTIDEVIDLRGRTTDCDTSNLASMKLPVLKEAALRNLTVVPKDHVRMDLSLILINGIANDELNTTILECLSTHTDTSIENWMVNERDAFATTFVQIDLYAIVKLSEVDEFLRETNEYIRENKLTECLKSKYAQFEENARVFPGRTVIASTFIGKDTVSNVQEWVIGVCIACIALLAVTALVVTAPGIAASEQEEEEAINNEENRAAGEEAEKEMLDSKFFTDLARNATVDEIAGASPNENISISTPAYNRLGL